MSDLTIKCEICGALLDEEDLFCPNCGTEAPQSHDPAAAHTTRSATESTHNFICSGCGASMSYDASAGSLRCPFCGSVKLEAQADHKVLAADFVVPFGVTHDAAVATMRSWLGQGFWRPGDLSEQALVVNMTAVYVPYWIFSATTHTYWTADTSQRPAGARSDWYPLSGEHRGEHSGVVVRASGALSPAETAALCPFDLSTAVKPAEADLNNAICEQFSVPRKYARPLARTLLESREAADCQAAYVPARCRNLHVNVLVEGLSSQPVLLPVWIMAYRYQDRVFRFLINGQSGRATGAAPTSKTKVAVAVAIGIAVVLVILLFAIR